MWQNNTNDPPLHSRLSTAPVRNGAERRLPANTRSSPFVPNQHMRAAPVTAAMLHSNANNNFLLPSIGSEKFHFHPEGSQYSSNPMLNGISGNQNGQTITPAPDYHQVNAVANTAPSTASTTTDQSQKRAKSEKRKATELQYQNKPETEIEEITKSLPPRIPSQSEKNWHGFIISMLFRCTDMQSLQGASTAFGSPRNVDMHTTQRGMHRAQKGQRLTSKVSVGDLLSVTKDILQLMTSWRAQDLKRHEANSQNWRLVLDSIDMLSVDIRKAKNPNSTAVKQAASFAICSGDEQEILSFLKSSITSKRGNKQTTQSALSMLARGQTRAHDILQREIVASFFLKCPVDCPLRTGSAAAPEEISSFATSLLADASYLTDANYEDAWFQACVVAKAKARTTALAVREDIRAILPDSIQYLPSVWVKNEEEATGDFVYMSVAAYAFVVTKVSFAIRRLCARTNPQGEVNTSHQVPWARQALAVDDILDFSADEEGNFIAWVRCASSEVLGQDVHVKAVDTVGIRVADTNQVQSRERSSDAKFVQIFRHVSVEHQKSLVNKALTTVSHDTLQSITGDTTASPDDDLR
eukprot:IDg1346t1